MRILFVSSPRRASYTQLDIRGSEQKPFFRGLLHAAAAVAIPCTRCFFTLPSSAPFASRIAFYTFVASCLACYLVSALYHIGSFDRRMSSFLQRVDQAFIFILTAGSYTPSALMASSPQQSLLFLVVVWAFAFIGAWHVLAHNRLIWFVVSAASAIPLWLFWVLPNASIAQIGLALGGWGSYAIGFLCYMTTKPRLLPRVFGYHELFHVCSIIAGVCTAHYNQAAVQYYIDRQPEIVL
jgi:hemolysin III